jgi:pimeloyl-ACP methyl ester carboxylesterase
MNAYGIDHFLQRRRRPRPHFSGRDGLSMLSVPSGDVRVRVSGSGRHTVVFVCDAPIFIEHYDRLFTLLGDRYRVVCMELLGMGFSVPNAAFTFTLAEQASAVEQVLRALGVTSSTLVCPCVNGYLAMLVAQNAPALVSKVTVLQTPSWEEEKRWARAIDFRGRGWVATPILGQFIVAASQRVIARKWFAKALHHESDAADFTARSTAALDAGCGWALASLTQAYFSAPNPLLSPVSQPALVIWGNQDRTHRKTDKSSVLQYFRDAEMLSFSKSGHSPELEEPALFVEHLTRLIEQR